MPKRRDDKDGQNGDLGTIVRPELDRETDTKKKVERPPLYEVMLHVHTKGLGVAGIFPFEIAETKAHQVVAFARENEMPLQASLRKSQET